METPEEQLDPVMVIQEALSSLDPSALVTGYITIVEWVDQDGQPSLSVLHSPMTPWHQAGLLKYASDWEGPLVPVVFEDVDDSDED